MPETHIWTDKESDLLRPRGQRPIKFGQRFDGSESKGLAAHIAAGRAMKIEDYAAHVTANVMAQGNATHVDKAAPAAPINTRGTRKVG